MHQLNQRPLPACNHGFGPGAALGIPLAMLTLVGCQGERTQSSLHPAGPAADSVATLWWILLAVLGLYALAVFALTLVAIFRKGSGEQRQADQEIGDNRGAHEGRVFILVGGVVLPAIILVPLLIYSLTTTVNLRMRDSGLTIRVEGHMWWWNVEYPEHGLITANELIIPAGEPVRLELTSADVIHSFWVPQLHGKMDLLPGQTSEFWIEADRPGRYRGQCAEYCGKQHALMAFEVVALPPEEFVDWLQKHSSGTNSSVAKTPQAKLQAQLQESTAGEQAKGQRLFFQHGCGVCHAIKDTPARGLAGPDLTWIASRNTLAAGTIINTRENLLHWLADPQSLKPGAKMPATHAPEEELELIVSFLHSLEGTEEGHESNEQ